MGEHAYKMIEIVGSSPVSSDDAIRNAVSKAAKSEEALRWFELTDLRGHLKEGQIAHWQATVKIGFRLDEE